MRDNFLVFGAPQISDAEIDEVTATLRSRWLGTGPKVARFEQAFAEYKGITPAQTAAVNSCTAALHLSMVACDLKPGDEVITTAMTFCATVNAIIHAGATPVPVDIDPRTRNIDPAAVAAAVTPRTKAILPVHFAGYPCDMDALLEIAVRHDLRVIEDCAHAIETEYHGRKAGTLGDFGCFSFYVTKNMVTGEGGMVIARDTDRIARVRRLALHGLSADAWQRFSDKGYKHYFVEECGFKYNMMDIQAAIGIHQLARLEENWQRRQHIWQRYQSAFGDLPLLLPADPAPGLRHAYHLYSVCLQPAAPISRDEFLQAMNQRKIGTGVHYLAIPEHPFYQQRFGWRTQDFPVATAIGRSTVSLPISAALTDDDVSDVIDAVRELLG
ncbi:MAG: DegT/DnrJ/EryC1/StrS family aminotransferase [Gammaproteobacteria bacterium]|nr:DegT/DnrJ/EryC1/StrS family aminotransferase [Gammaproteobacteria bacterium]